MQSEKEEGGGEGGLLSIYLIALQLFVDQFQGGMDTPLNRHIVSSECIQTP